MPRERGLRGGRRGALPGERLVEARAGAVEKGARGALRLRRGARRGLGVLEVARLTQHGGAAAAPAAAHRPARLDHVAVERDEPRAIAVAARERRRCREVLHQVGVRQQLVHHRSVGRIDVDRVGRRPEHAGLARPRRVAAGSRRSQEVERQHRRPAARAANGGEDRLGGLGGVDDDVLGAAPEGAGDGGLAPWRHAEQVGDAAANAGDAGGEGDARSLRVPAPGLERCSKALGAPRERAGFRVRGRVRRVVALEPGARAVDRPAGLVRRLPRGFGTVVQRGRVLGFGRRGTALEGDALPLDLVALVLQCVPARSVRGPLLLGRRADRPRLLERGDRVAMRALRGLERRAGSIGLRARGGGRGRRRGTVDGRRRRLRVGLEPGDLGPGRVLRRAQRVRPVVRAPSLGARHVQDPLGARGRGQGVPIRGLDRRALAAQRVVRSAGGCRALAQLEDLLLGARRLAPQRVHLGLEGGDPGVAGRHAQDERLAAERRVPFGGLGLVPQQFDALPKLEKHVLETRKMEARGVEAGLGLLAAPREPGNAGRFGDVPEEGRGVRHQHLGDLALADDRDACRPEPRSGERLVDVEEACRATVEPQPARAIAIEVAPHLEGPFAVRELDLDLRVPEAPLPVGTVEDQVRLRFGSELARAAATRHPLERVQQVALTGAVGADDGRDARRELHRGAVPERFEPGERQLREAHGGAGPVSAPRARAGSPRSRGCLAGS